MQTQMFAKQQKGEKHENGNPNPRKQLDEVQT
jgi:hypothetical protein